MPWTGDPNYQVGPPGGTLSTILDYATGVRIRSEWSVGFRGNDVMSQYQHGEDSSPRKFHPASNLSVEIAISGTNSSGTITHTDGEEGHRIENFQALKQLFIGKQGSLVRLERTFPDTDTTYLDIWQVADVKPTQNRLMYAWPMRAPRPFWIGTADTANTGSTLTVAGDASIDDMVIDFASGTDPRITHDDTGDWIEIAGAMPGAGVRVDVGLGTCVQITGGADYSNNLRVNTPWWFELDPGANAVTASAGISSDWFTKWR